MFFLFVVYAIFAVYFIMASSITEFGDYVDLIHGVMVLPCY